MHFDYFTLFILNFLIFQQFSFLIQLFIYLLKFIAGVKVAVPNWLAQVVLKILQIFNFTFLFSYFLIHRLKAFAVTMQSFQQFVNAHTCVQESFLQWYGRGSCEVKHEEDLIDCLRLLNAFSCVYTPSYAAVIEVRRCHAFKVPERLRHLGLRGQILRVLGICRSFPVHLRQSLMFSYLRRT